MGYRHEAWMDDRLGSLDRGENPTMILKMKSGYVVLGDYQFLPGYCVLLHSPCAESLNELTPADRAQFLKDMTLIGDAIMAVCHPLRLNYAILMNYDHFLHAHIQARYAWEPEVYGKGSVWNYPQAHRCDDKYFFTGEQYLALQKKIKVALSELLDSIGYWEDTACP